MKAKYLFIFLLITKLNSFAQNLDELQSINVKAKFQFVTPETLDRIMAGMRLYESNPVTGQDSLMLDTYNSVINGYMVNNHFKQAYETFNRYLTYKEKMLSDQKSKALADANQSVDGRQSKDDKEQVALQDKMTRLIAENVRLDSKRISFKRNFSFALIVLSALFAIMLVSGGIKLLNLRSELTRSHERMKEIHRNALSGRLSGGITGNFSTAVSTIESDSKELQQILKQQDQNFPASKQAGSILSGIEKTLKDIRKKFQN